MNLASKILAASVAFSLSLFAPVVPAVAQDESDLDQAASSPYSAEVQIEEESSTYEEEPNSSSSLSGEGSLDAPGSPNELDATDGEASNESYTLAETTESSEEEPSYNKADFYEEDDESAVMMSSDGQRAASISPMYLSDEMKYFAKYESSCNYDQGFSRGDGYHALGYYQFDHRYGLMDFLLACYAYDSATYSMFRSVLPAFLRLISEMKTLFARTVNSPTWATSLMPHGMQHTLRTLPSSRRFRMAGRTLTITFLRKIIWQVAELTSPIVRIA